MQQKKKRRHLVQTVPLGQRLTAEAKRLRKEARTAPGFEREQLMGKARQIEAAVHIDDCLSSPILQRRR